MGGNITGMDMKYYDNTILIDIIRVYLLLYENLNMCYRQVSRIQHTWIRPGPLIVHVPHKVFFVAS